MADVIVNISIPLWSQDPAALKQYRRKFESDAFQTSLKKFGWDNLRTFVSDQEIGMKVYFWLGARGDVIVIDEK